MSRSLWRCQNRLCPIPHGAVLGRVTGEGGLVLDVAVETYTIYMDTRRAVITCPCCGQSREFRGGAVFSAVRAQTPATGLQYAATSGVGPPD
jgi:hypothetical protein